MLDMSGIQNGDVVLWGSEVPIPVEQHKASFDGWINPTDSTIPNFQIQIYKALLPPPHQITFVMLWTISSFVIKCVVFTIKSNKELILVLHSFNVEFGSFRGTNEMIPAGRSIFAQIVLLTTRFDRKDSASCIDKFERLKKMWGEMGKKEIRTAVGRSSNCSSRFTVIRS